MTGQITLEEPLVIDDREWAELVSQIKDAVVTDAHGFTNPMTGDIVQISSSTKVEVRLNGELAKRPNLIATQTSKGKQVVAFRLTPFCDTIEFEGEGAGCKKTMGRVAFGNNDFRRGPVNVGPTFRAGLRAHQINTPHQSAIP